MQRSRGRSVSLLPLFFLGAGNPLVQPQSPQRWQADIQIRTLEITKMKTNMSVRQTLASILANV